MKISPITFQNIHPIKQNKQNFNNKNNLKNDVFIKSSNQISFQKNTLNSQFKELKKEIDAYFLHNTKLSEDKIKTILKKYLPYVRYEIHSFSLKDGGFNSSYSSDIKLITTNNKSRFVSFEPILYTNIITTATTDTKEATKISLLHECIHALQDFSKDKVSKAEFLNSLLKKYPDLDIKTLTNSSKIFNQLENFFTNMIVDIINSNTTSKNSQELIQEYKNFKFNKFTSKYLKTNSDSLIKSTILKLIQQNKIQNPKVTFEYILYEAQREIEAYAKTPAKNVGPLSQASNFDNTLQIDIHKEIFKAAKKLFKLTEYQP